MARTLVLDSTGDALSAVALEGEHVLHGRDEPLLRGRAERLLPLLAALLADLGWRWTDLDRLLVGIGPGGFTGIRAGVAVGRALALALDRPVLGIGRLEALAAAAGPGALPLACLADPRRGTVALQRFAGDGTPLGQPESCPLDEAARRLDRPHRLAGDGTVLLADPPGSAHVRLDVRADARAHALAGLRRLAAGERPVAGSELRPLYLRGADARPEAGAALVMRRVA